MTDEEITVEKTFEVKDSPDQAWKKLETLTADHDTEPGMWWLPGFQCRATEVAAAAGHRLEVVKAEQPCKDTTIVFTFEHVGTGTRIHVVQSGFDPAFVEMQATTSGHTVRSSSTRSNDSSGPRRTARTEPICYIPMSMPCSTPRSGLRLAIRSSRSVTSIWRSEGFESLELGAVSSLPAFAGPHPGFDLRASLYEVGQLLFVPVDLCCEVVDAMFEVAAFGAVGYAADGAEVVEGSACGGDRHRALSRQ